ncbi:MAG: hypothetical protein OER88_04420, partial [Planctomycetota bacterium]|nr:hypothetical protein [Planctomycetota bacterium]
MTTVLLRAASLAVNVAFAFGLPWWLTGRVWVAAAIATVFFGVVAWASRRAPPYRAACDDVSEIATQVCERLGAPPPRFVGECDGWTAGVVRSSGGYGFILGHRVEPEHRGAVLAHEVAHALSGDLSWEPWTDGPA